MDAAPDVETSRATSTKIRQTAPILSCRQLTDADVETAVALLCRGFPERLKSYWSRALERLRTRSVPEGRPRYGYVLVDRGRFVGIVLLIFAETDKGAIRGNVSSWYVEDAYRGFSHILLSVALKAKGVSLFNISPAPTTFQTVEAQGFTRYVDGTFLCLAALARRAPRASIRAVRPGEGVDRILSDHAGWGCLSLQVVQSGVIYPFVFVPHRIFGGRVPCVQLAYCRDHADFLRFAGLLGRFLLRRGFLLIAIDANAPLPGLFGTYRAGRTPKFSRGPDVPRAGDLTYTELTIFGP